MVGAPRLRLHVRQAHLHGRHSRAPKFQFSHNVTRQSAGTAVTPAAMRGSSKAERSVQHSGRGGRRDGGGGFYSKEISREMGPFSPTLLQRKNDTSIVQLRP